MTETGDVTVDVVVPTYRRPAHLERCLSAIAGQTRPAAQVVVVAREDDVDSHEVVRAIAEGHPYLRLVTVNEPGVIAAMSAGVAATTAPLVAFTDDDAAPHPDWLDRILRYFEDPTVGAVGGRDVMWHDGTTEPPDRTSVGTLQWFGRVIGNHHLGVGPPREVDVLKGVNCAYRKDVLVGIGFDRRLRGPGAQVHWELSLGLALRRDGWRLIYDPAILVDHFEAERHDVPRVGEAKTAGRALADATFNETVVLLSHLRGWRRITYLLWSTMVGSQASPGVTQALRLTARHGISGVTRWWAATSGRGSALRRPRPYAVQTAGLCPPSPTTLSAIVIAQDEQERIERCVESCWKAADEVVLVDGGSTDSTPEFGTRLGCKVVINPWPGFAEQRRVGIAHASGDWIMFVDADEEVGDDLAAAIHDMLRIPTGWHAFRVSRVGDFMGRWMAPDVQVRVCRRSHARIPDVLVHETLDVPANRTGTLPGTLWHHGYRSIEDHVARFDRYTTLEAEEAWRSRKRPSVPRLLLRPLARIAEKLVLRGLWRRGVPGVAASGFWGFYELLRELKLFERYRQDDQT